MKKYIGIIGLAAIVTSASAQARPISYPDGTMLMLQNDDSRNAASLDYTFTPTLALGYRFEYDRDENFQLHTLTMNNRLWRGNYHDAQANLYLLSGIGYALANGSTENAPAAFTGIETDWENRRFFVSYENRYLYADDVDRKFNQSARIGVAPYIAEAGSLHAWFMLQADHRPGSNDTFTVTPLVRFFKDTHLLEAGVSNRGEILFNYTHQF